MGDRLPNESPNQKRAPLAVMWPLTQPAPIHTPLPKPWVDRDEERLARRITSIEHLSTFWKMMLDIFKCGPYHLFTWSIRIDPHDENEIIKELCEILPHEAFDGNITVLQYILQLAVFFRARYRVKPFNSRSDPRRMGDHVPAAVVGSWGRTAGDFVGKVLKLTAELCKHMQDKAEDVSRSPFGSESVLFILRRRDIHTIKVSLDALKDQGVYRHSVSETNMLYMLENRHRWEDLAPSSIAELKIFEKNAILVRRHARAKGRPDVPPGHQLNKLDWRALIYRADPILNAAMFFYDDSWYPTF